MQKIISCKEAISKNQNWFFTGVPCNAGHISVRLVSTGRCRECERLRKSKWAEDNKSLVQSLAKSRYESNKESLLEKAKRYRRANKHRSRARCAKRRATLHNAVPPWLTDEHWTQIRAKYQDAKEREELLGGKWQVDHYFPLQSPFGCGLHVPGNLCVIPQSENGSKSNKPPDEFESFWHTREGAHIPPFKRIEKNTIIEVLEKLISETSVCDLCGKT